MIAGANWSERIRAVALHRVGLLALYELVLGHDDQSAANDAFEGHVARHHSLFNSSPARSSAIVVLLSQTLSEDIEARPISTSE